MAQATAHKAAQRSAESELKPVSTLRHMEIPAGTYAFNLCFERQETAWGYDHLRVVQAGLVFGDPMLFWIR